MAAIEIKHLVKTYDDGFLAVDDVSLDVADGELMVLAGPSGSGKSTLLRMIVGLEEITSGDMIIGGTRVNDQGPRERNLSMVFQSYALYPHLSVYENIAFPLRLQKMDDAEVDLRVIDAADVLDLRDHLRRKPAHLSGGQRQRVAMGRAIVRRAEAFLFDEPLSNLDAKLRGQMRTEIARLQRRLAMTTVYVTHDQTEAMTLGDRVCVLRRGTVAQVASPRELYEQPANLFVAGFLGSPPMNFLAATVEDGGLATPLGLVPLDGARAAAVAGRDVVVVGIRPEAFEDASLLSETWREVGHAFTARVAVTEWLGDSQLTTIDCRAEESLLARLRGPEQELNADALPDQAVISIDTSSRVREGHDAQLWLDARKVHVFDHRTGENLTRDAEAGAELTRTALEDRAELTSQVRGESAGGPGR